MHGETLKLCRSNI